MASLDVSEVLCFANLRACSHCYYVAISAQLNELNHASLLLRSESLRHLSIASPNRSNTAQKALHKTCTLFLHLSACRNSRTKNFDSIQISAISWTANKFESFSCSLCVATTTAASDIVNGLLAKKVVKQTMNGNLLSYEFLLVFAIWFTLCDLPPKSRTSGRANYI